MVKTYPDGSTIELGCGNTHPPGWKGQHGNVNHAWIRKNGGPWVIYEGRSTYIVRFWIEAAENADEAFEAIFPGPVPPEGE